MGNGSLKDSQNDKNEHTLLHKCDAYLVARVDIELSITESNQLVSCARYDTFFDGFAPWMRSLLVCPHAYLASCLQHSRDRCAACDTYSERSSSNSDTITVRVSRYLGRDKWFGDSKSAANSHSTCFAYQWYRQSRNISDYTPTLYSVPLSRDLVRFLRCSLATTSSSVHGNMNTTWYSTQESRP